MKTERETDNELSTQLKYGNMKELLEYHWKRPKTTKRNALQRHIYKLRVDVLTMFFCSNDS